MTEELWVRAPSTNALLKLSAGLSDSVERVTSWINRARSKARAEHDCARASKQRKEHKEKKARELAVKRKAEADVECVVAEKRRQLAYFGGTDDTEALRSKVLELMPLVDTVAALKAKVEAAEAAEAASQVAKAATRAIDRSRPSRRRRGKRKRPGASTVLYLFISSSLYLRLRSSMNPSHSSCTRHVAVLNNVLSTDRPTVYRHSST